MIPTIEPPDALVAQTLRLAARHSKRTSWNPNGFYLDWNERPCKPEEAASMCLQGAVRLAAYELANGRDPRYNLIVAAHYRLS